MQKKYFISLIGIFFSMLIAQCAFAMNGSSAWNDPIFGCTDPLACNYDASATDDDGSCELPSPYYPDGDSDGFGDMYTEEYYCVQPQGYVSNPGDCDDSKADVYLGATEICNDFDDDCDGELDNGVTNDYYLDADGDGFGWLDALEMACDQPLGYVTNADDCDDALWLYTDLDGDGIGAGDNVACGDVTENGDCDDQNPQVSPIAQEVCNGSDDDCDEEIDEFVTTTFFVDADGDGFGNASESGEFCDVQPGYVTNSDDCDDATLMYADLDGDGFGFGAALDCGDVTSDGDCNDEDVNIFPSATEICGNDTDEDCDGLDIICEIGCTQPLACNYNAAATQEDGSCYYPDADYLDCNGNCLSDTDGDGVCDEIEVGGCMDASACNYDALATDQGICIYPQQEICNDLDDDCDGEVDNGALLTFYLDFDGDGFGDGQNTTFACAAPTGYVNNSDDCDDNLLTYDDADGDGFGSAVPSACGVTLDHSDCDEGNVTYDDNDGDGYGAGDPVSCGSVFTNNDCADDNNLLFPGATEICGNDIDEDCDGQDVLCVPGCTAMDACNYNPNANQEDGTCYYPETLFLDCDGNCLSDTDGDGICDEIEVSGCTDATACNYNESATDPGVCIYPQAEVCNSIDDDCDGEIDNGVTLTFYQDVDGDGFGNAQNTTFACSAPTGYVDNMDDCDDNALTYEDLDGDGFGGSQEVACGSILDNTDCDDNDGAINPEASEVCNNLDDNCNGDVDEFVTITYYADVDGDGFGNASDIGNFCSLPLGYVENAEDCDDTQLTFDDLDGDGYGYGDPLSCGTVFTNDDCDETNSMINPGALEICNDIDDDCDQETDEFVTTNYYADVDVDGFGNVDSMVVSCTAPEGFVVNFDDCDDQALTYDDLDGDGFGFGNLSACGTVDNNLDCNDGDQLIYPGATEVCNAQDDDCDEEIDEFVTSTFYADQDGDGFGTDFDAIEACDQPVGYVNNFDDCDDNALSYEDLDGDGYGAGNAVACGSSAWNSDCNDADGSVSPGVEDVCGDGIDNDCMNGDSICQVVGCMDPLACNYNALANIDDICIYSSIEICDSIDNDCDGEVDEFVTTTYYADLDGDGFGDANNTTEACSLPLGYVNNDLDCDDALVGYDDLDGDGFGFGPSSACGTAIAADDCLDNNASVNPSATEICNQLDDDCDTEIDEFVTSTFYADQDGDGFGNPNDSIVTCDTVAGYVTNNLDCVDTLITYNDLDNDGYGFGPASECGTATNADDCDDTSAAIAPNIQEICNGIDDDCDIEVDNGVLIGYYADTDGDGFGNAQVALFACTPPVGYVSNADDCDDTVITYQDSDNDGFGGLGFDACGVVTNDDCNENDITINPGATEVCGNNIDENCNAFIDENCAIDADGDGYSNLDDCDDTNPNIYPDQVETCNGIDDNCNNLIDDNLIFVVYYVDQDIDGYGTAESDTLCQAPSVGYATETGDCDDANANINPGVVEAFNGIDDNCDGFIDEDMLDTDGDGVENSLDADDDNDGLLDDVEDDFNGDGIGGDDCDGDGLPNTLDADQCPVFIPEGFSPNNDGVNDVFEIQQLPYGAVVEVEIYNRWGSLVYESSDYKNNWGGVNNDNEALPSGVYYYVVRLANIGFEKTNPLTIWR